MPPRQAIVAPVWTGEGARRFGGSAESFLQRSTLEYSPDRGGGGCVSGKTAAARADQPVTDAARCRGMARWCIQAHACTQAARARRADAGMMTEALTRARAERRNLATSSILQGTRKPLCLHTNNVPQGRLAQCNANFQSKTSTHAAGCLSNSGLVTC